MTPEKSEELVEDFLKYFKVGVTHHFKIEEKALFPILRSNVKDAEPFISELISEHKDIINKYFKLQNGFTQTRDLTDLLKALSTHAGKEERVLPPLIAFLNGEQLQKIDELTKRLGYSLLAVESQS